MEAERESIWEERGQQEGRGEVGKTEREGSE